MKRVAISEICSINPRLPASIALQKDRDVDFVPMANLSEDGRISLNGSRKLGEVLKGYTYFENGDVLVAKITPCMENGKAAYVHDLTHGIGFGSTEFHVLRPNPGVEPRYLFHMVWAPYFRNEAARNMTGTAGQQRVPSNFFERFEIPLPPLPEQKRIADILDKADAIRRKRREAVKSLEDLSDSLFQQFSAGAETQGKTIAELLESHVLLVHKDGNYGGSYPRKHEFGSVGIPFLSAKHVGADGTLLLDDVPRLNEEKARTLTFGWIERGDVLLAHNATVGPVALYRGDFPEALIGTSLTCFRPNPKFLTSEFLFAALRGSHFQQQLQKEMSQTTRNQVPITAQRRLTLYVPELKEQTAFANQLSGTHQLREKYSGSACEAETLFNCLVQRAFRGEL